MRKSLYEIATDYTASDEDGKVIITLKDGRQIKRKFQISISPKVSDSECLRIRHNNKYYYFG